MIMNLEVSGCDVTERTIQNLSEGNCGKPRKCLTITDIQIESRTGHLPHTNQTRYCLAQRAVV
jgi:hypothetical protein